MKLREKLPPPTPADRLMRCTIVSEILWAGKSEISMSLTVAKGLFALNYHMGNVSKGILKKKCHNFRQYPGDKFGKSKK